MPSSGPSVTHYGEDQSAARGPGHPCREGRAVPGSPSRRSGQPTSGLGSVVRFYTPVVSDYPRSDRIGLRVELLQQGFRLAALVRARVVNLTQTPPTDPNAPVLRRIQRDLAALYLAAATISQRRASPAWHSWTRFTRTRTG